MSKTPLHWRLTNHNLNADQILTRLPIQEMQHSMGEDTEKGEQILQQELPDELIALQILTKLPIKHVIRFKSVSKQWCSTLSSSQFAHIYSKLSRFSRPCPYTRFLIIKKGTKCYLYCHDDDDGDIRGKFCDDKKNLINLRIGFNEKLKLIGSCNGLVCLASFSGCFFILWNPITGKVQEYRDHELVINSSKPRHVAWGFGYVSDVDDYKVVRIIQLDDTPNETWVHVFSLNSNKWTRIAAQDIFSLRYNIIERIESGNNETSMVYTRLSFHPLKGVLVDETIYWIVHDELMEARKVISFDLVSEVFCTVADIELRSTYLYSDDFLCELGGCLSKCGVNMRDDVSIKMLKGKGEYESIFLSRDLRLSSCEDLVGFTRTGKFFIQIEYSRFGLVDPCSKPKKYEQLLKFEGPGKSCVTGYVPALTYIPPLANHDL